MFRTNLIKTAVVLGVGATGIALTAGCGRPDVTKTRLEGSLAPTFANLYVQRAHILGETGVTATDVHASATCDKGGPKVPDVGAGPNWVCTITFRDDHGQQQNGKFELQARTDSTYVAGGPSKLIGGATITDTNGKDVPNPVFEFDGAFDPYS